MGNVLLLLCMRFTDPVFRPLGSVMNILNKMPAIQSRTKPGYFNDMDMLEIGNGGQSDSEYVIHFSMWALQSSPLLIGTNIGTLSPSNLAIYSNPAIIALNQDKSAGGAHRNWRYFVDPDETGEGEISMWTRTLDNGDRVVAFLNAANTSQAMNASMDEIFFDERTAGAYQQPEELRQSWDVYDLWANRMSNDEARSILNGNATGIGANSTTRYNATAVSYEEGIMANKTALLGQKIGRIMPSGTFTAEVARHSVGMFRLRAASTPAPLIRRDEL
jgi:alpha-galactosidase